MANKIIVYDIKRLIKQLCEEVIEESKTMQVACIICVLDDSRVVDGDRELFKVIRNYCLKGCLCICHAEDQSKMMHIKKIHT
jgi:hypothetical protein